MTISKSGLQSGNPLELLKFAWLLNEQKLKDAFLKVRVGIDTDDDLIDLAKLSVNKADIRGLIKDENNNPIMFDVVRIVSGLSGYTQQEKQNAKSFNYIA